MAQENLIKESRIPFTIVRSTQFFEFAKGIIESATNGQTVRLSSAFIQPIAADDVAVALTGFALSKPLNGTIEIAGPEPIRMDDFAGRFLSAMRDPRKVTTDVHALYFGTELNDKSLIPGKKARLGTDAFRGVAQSLHRAKGSVNLGHGGRSHDSLRSAVSGRHVGWARNISRTTNSHARKTSQ